MKAGEIILTVFGMILRVAVVIFAVYVIYQGALKSYDYGYRIFTEKPVTVTGNGKTVKVAVAKEMSPSDIGNLFEKEGLTRDAKLFTMQYYLSEYKNDVKPGIYELNTTMTAEEMMAVMAGMNEVEAETETDDN